MLILVGKDLLRCLVNKCECTEHGEAAPVMPATTKACAACGHGDFVHRGNDGINWPCEFITNGVRCVCTNYLYPEGEVIGGRCNKCKHRYHTGWCNIHIDNTGKMDKDWCQCVNETAISVPA